MPFYEYECDNCKFYTELLQKITDTPLKKCPSCGKNTMKKLVSAPVFRLKGGGWYETDFKSDKEGKRNLAVEKEPESTSDAKPAAAADATDKGKSSETKPTESKSTEAKATESKATESKPAESASSRSGSRSRARPSAASKSKATAKSRSKPAAKRRKSR